MANLEKELVTLLGQIESKRKEQRTLEEKAESLSDPDQALDAHIRSQSISQWLLPKMQTGLRDLVTGLIERDAAAEGERIDRETAEKIHALEAGYQELAEAFAAWQTALVPLRKAQLFARLFNTFGAAFPLANITAVAQRLQEEIAAWRLRDISTIKDEAGQQKREAVVRIRAAAQKRYLAEPENEPAELAAV